MDQIRHRRRTGRPLGTRVHGQPPIDKNGYHRTSVVLSQEIETALDERADSLGITRSEMLREICNQWLTLGGAPPERGYLAGWRVGLTTFLQHANTFLGDVKRDIAEGRLVVPTIDDLEA